MTETRKGILSLVGACLIWGLAPIYYKLLAEVPAIDVLGHRTLWSFVFFGLVLAVQGRLAEVPRLLGPRRSRGLILLAALCIALNWFLFIWAILAGRALEASLGYYIFPLVAVLMGRLAFGERLDWPSRIAVALAAVAVLILGIGLGAAPWIPLSLALSFGLYGIIKKVLAAGPVVTVTVEAMIVAPVVIGALLLSGDNPFAFRPAIAVLLVLSGPITAAPLVMFSYAARRVPYGTIGLIQYLNPTMQFLTAALIFHEPLSRWHFVAMPLIWLALALYSAAALARERAARKAATAAGTSGRAVM
jgi:chloramphenicol-sensitive protein RarD